jgi:hypothetical protein
VFKRIFVLIICFLSVVFFPTVNAKKLTMAEVKAKLSQLKKDSPHNQCVNKNNWRVCVDLIIGNDRDLYFKKITSDLDQTKKIALTNYLIGYVLKNKEILTDERLTKNERKSLLALRKEQHEYGLVERIPERLLKTIFDFDLKSSNFFMYIAFPYYASATDYLAKSAKQHDNAKKEVYGKLIAKTYYKKLVNNIESLPVFYDQVLSKCTFCDKKYYVAKFNKLPSYGKNIKTSSPRSSIEFNYVFKPSIEAGWIDEKLSIRYQNLFLTNVKEIPYFIDSVLNKCSNCNNSNTYKNLVKTKGFGSNARDFFQSIEYKYVLKHFPYHEVVSKYFDYAVDFERDLPKFFDSILNKCSSGCSPTEYYKKALQLSDINFNLDLNSFSSSLIYQYVIKNLSYNIKGYSSGSDFSLNLSVANKSFNTSFNGVCDYSHATSSRDDATFWQALRGASEAINHHDIYKCRLSSNDLNRIEKFTQIMKSTDDYHDIVAKKSWTDARFTYATLIYPPPPTAVAGSYDSGGNNSSYNSSSSNSTLGNLSSSTSNRSSSRSKGVKEIYNGGSKSSQGHIIYIIKCHSGSGTSAYQDSNDWWNDSGGSNFGERYRRLSKQDFGNKYCNNR